MQNQTHKRSAKKGKTDGAGPRPKKEKKKRKKREKKKDGKLGVVNVNGWLSEKE